jgi:hypothetical protein
MASIPSDLVQDYAVELPVCVLSAPALRVDKPLTYDAKPDSNDPVRGCPTLLRGIGTRWCGLHWT